MNNKTKNRVFIGSTLATCVALVVALSIQAPAEGHGRQQAGIGDPIPIAELDRTGPGLGREL